MRHFTNKKIPVLIDRDFFVGINMLFFYFTDLLNAKWKIIKMINYSDTKTLLTCVFLSEIVLTIYIPALLIGTLSFP